MRTRRAQDERVIDNGFNDCGRSRQQESLSAIAVSAPALGALYQTCIDLRQPCPERRENAGGILRLGTNSTSVRDLRNTKIARYR